MTGAGHGWWRRNALALVAVVVLAGATAWAQTAQERSARDGYTPTRPVHAAPGETLEFAGATYTVVDVERLYPGGLPRGTAALRVTVDVAAAADGALPEMCTIRIEESAGSHGRREWLDAAYSPVDFLEVEGTRTSCSSGEDDDGRGAFRLAVPFVVPSDVDGTLTLRVETTEAIPHYAALELGPLP